MDVLERLKLRTNEPDEATLLDCMECAKNAYMSRRFPYQEWPDDVEKKYQDLWFRMALDVYNKSGAEGEISHIENGVRRSYESSWISVQLLSEIIPYAGTL